MPWPQVKHAFYLAQINEECALTWDDSNCRSLNPPSPSSTIQVGKFTGFYPSASANGTGKVGVARPEWLPGWLQFESVSWWGSACSSTCDPGVTGVSGTPSEYRWAILSP
ncbi:hypothetical protein GORHZ_085_00010 [Gordonia rhizosphera NBRC 16068]|uniref:Uncharacterized protein n=1 Tax=Gordonia rhizosphera NBRC 16068 TaxID=1108045 RepID=K6WU98_9ACTN|nr:hypothetical protein GORHZ_085_00010 [Gordonia rhizosphera NBRC 16068]